MFSDDWGRHPSSCQHLVRQLAAEYRVLWVNTIGTRSPKLDTATVRRALGKLFPSPASPSAPNDQPPSPVRVLNPLMWPWFRNPFDRALNRRLLSSALRTAVATLPRPVIAVTTIPLVADLVGSLAVDRWVYYCVDDLAAWPGLDGKPLQAMERELLAKVDDVITVSDFLHDRLQKMGRGSTVISHGVDLPHWAGSSAVSRLPASLGELPTPWILFWGLIDERLDQQWLLRLADSLPSGKIVLVGPVVAMSSRLSEHPRIALTGPVSYQVLPALANHASVLVMPYKTMPATEAMQPLKLKEYLATSLPCVVPQLPSTLPWKDCVDIAASGQQFAEAVLTRLETGLPSCQRSARLRLADESWQAKAGQFTAVLEGELGSIPSIA